MSDLQDVIAANAVKAYNEGFSRGEASERKRIIATVQSRINELRACSKRDNCQELAATIESYVAEWTERDQK